MLKELKLKDENGYIFGHKVRSIVQGDGNIKYLTWKCRWGKEREIQILRTCDEVCTICQ
jgi:hypothetical protein